MSETYPGWPAYRWERVLLAAAAMLPVALLIGRLELVVVAAGTWLLFRKKRQWFMHRGPRLVASTTPAPHTATWKWILVGSAAVAGLMYGTEFLYGQEGARLMLIALLAALLVWRTPGLGAAILLLGAAAVGGDLILLSPPLAIMLARRQNRLSMKLGRSVRRTLTTLGLAVVAFLLTLPFANLRIGQANAGGSGGVGGATGQAGGAEPTSGVLRRIADAVSSLFGNGNPGNPSGVAPPPPPPPEPRNFWWLLALAAAALLVSLLTWLFFWWRRRPKGSGAEAMSLARLEAIGKAVGRPRQPGEGAMAYADALSNYTGDDRLRPAGNAVSNQLYLSPSADDTVVEGELKQLEAAPPPAPPKPRFGRLRATAKRVASNPRPVLAGTASCALLVAGGWLAVTQLGQLTDVAADELADYDVGPDTPELWHQLLQDNRRDTTAWQMCEVIEDGSSSTSSLTVGLTDTTRDVGLTVDTVQFTGGWTSQMPAEALQRGTLAVGTGDAGWTAIASFASTPKVEGDEWFEAGPYELTTQTFTTVDDVLEAMPLRDPMTFEMTDSRGQPFVRYESRPIQWSAVTDEDDARSMLYPDMGFASSERMWAVDIWTDPAGKPVRVRQMAEDAPGWSEWRRLDDPASLRLPDCTPGAAGGNVWMGRERWTASRAVEPRIARTADGHLYETNEWLHGFAVAEDIGSIDRGIEWLGVTDQWALWEESSEPAGVDLGGQEWLGADLAALVADGYWHAVRLQPSGGDSTVDRWQEVQGGALDDYPVVMFEPDLPTRSFEDLEPSLVKLYEEESEGFVVLDWSGDGLADSLLLGADFYGAGVYAGYNENGQIVSVLMWDSWLPWRQLGLEGEAPAAVLDREAELEACLAGDRPIDLSGYCTTSDSDE